MEGGLHGVRHNPQRRFICEKKASVHYRSFGTACCGGTYRSGRKRFRAAVLPNPDGFTEFDRERESGDRFK